MRAQLTDAGVVIATQRYDAWGAPRQAQRGRVGFTGELQRPGSDVYLRARWYQPQRGSFASVDPFAGFAETPYSLHQYAYAYSQPNLLTDPRGQSPLACLPFFATGVGASIGGGCLVLAAVAIGAVALVGFAQMTPTPAQPPVVMPFPVPQEQHFRLPGFDLGGVCPETRFIFVASDPVLM